MSNIVKSMVTKAELSQALRLAGSEQSRLWNEGRPYADTTV